MSQKNRIQSQSSSLANQPLAKIAMTRKPREKNPRPPESAYTIRLPAPAHPPSLPRIANTASERNSRTKKSANRPEKNRTYRRNKEARLPPNAKLVGSRAGDKNKATRSARFSPHFAPKIFHAPGLYGASGRAVTSRATHSYILKIRGGGGTLCARPDALTVHSD